jgi:hypothetical protein
MEATGVAVESVGHGVLGAERDGGGCGVVVCGDIPALRREGGGGSVRRDSEGV